MLEMSKLEKWRTENQGLPGVGSGAGGRLVKECHRLAGDGTFCAATVAVNIGTYASDNAVEDEIHTWTGLVKLEKSSEGR